MEGSIGKTSGSLAVYDGAAAAITALMYVTSPRRTERVAC